MRRSILLLLAATSFVPAAADARPRTLAPPGNSAVSEYLEVVPTDRGQSPPSSGGSGGGGAAGSRSRALSPAQQRSLDRLGADGRALSNLVTATAPGSASDPATSAVANSAGQAAPRVRPVPSAGGAVAEAGSAAAAVSPGLTGAPPAAPAGKLLSAVVAPGGGGGLGIFVPGLILAGALLISVRLALRLRRA